MIRTLTLGGTALYALAAAAAFAQAPAPAEPAATAAADEVDGGEIIVTAQKRSERLQDVPVAVSVVSGEAIANQGRVNLEGAQYLVPALNFVKAGTALNQTLFLRGIGTTTFSIAVEPSVSTVLDGVVLSRAAEAFTDLVDIERIEVLRGPQGTLFGKNASAGVINIVSKRPGREFGGSVEGSYFFDNGNEYRVRGALDVPLSEQLRTRTTAFYDKYDGNIFNQAPTVNRRVNGFEHYGVRSIIEADPSETVKLTFIGDYHKNDDDCCADVIGGPPLLAFNSATPGAVNTTALALIQTVLPPLQGDETRRINQNLVTRTIEVGYGFSGQADVELGDQTVTSITSYRNFRNNEIRDGDFYSQPYIGAPQSHDFGPQTGSTFTQELRLTSPGKQFFDYVVGAFYSRTFTKRIFERQNIICSAAPGAVLPAGVLTPCTSPLAAPSVSAFGRATYGATAKNVALFGQGTLNVAERFRLIGGIRYTIDQLDTFFTRVTSPGNLASQPPLDQGVFDSRTSPANNGNPLASNGVPFKQRATADNFSGKAGAQFDVSEYSTAFASWTRGYKGPAYNLFFNLQPTGAVEIEPETSDSYELGLKNTLLDGRLTLNLAAYYARYKNFQANNPDSLTINGVTTTIARFTNAGTVSTRGGEVDLVFRAAPDFTISGGVAYSDAKVDRFKIPTVRTPNDVVPDGTPLAFAPKWKGSLSADYRIRTGGSIDFALGAQGSYQSKQLSLFVADPVQREAGTIGGYGLVNLSASIVESEDRYRLTFQVRNLFDQSFASAISSGGPSGAYRYQITRDADRYFGVTGKVNF
ncbi:TonB-dependent receptor [Glacieibacterium frigidum]|uniref:TonB-dependent receptor n=1 Tax=Glacieibacterium frigidum TaxID=2593303 RepID=A0A552UFP3_9SPHN|nr:TonB-dependent receptor [Glacieibacterium frigidum]TRW17009.1 TonB-dependent receptor [Glacieibacterium frigidum]